MPLYIRDEAVAELARKAKAATGASTITETVRRALEREIAHADTTASFKERIAKAIALADTIGDGSGGDPNFNFKAFREELWGE